MAQPETVDLDCSLEVLEIGGEEEDIAKTSSKKSFIPETPDISVKVTDNKEEDEPMEVTETGSQIVTIEEEDVVVEDPKKKDAEIVAHDDEVSQEEVMEVHQNEDQEIQEVSQNNDVQEVSQEKEKEQKTKESETPVKQKNQGDEQAAHIEVLDVEDTERATSPKKRRPSQEDEIEVLDELAENSAKKTEKITVEISEEVSVKEGNITNESKSSSQGEDADIEMLDQSAVGSKERVKEHNSNENETPTKQKNKDGEQDVHIEVLDVEDTETATSPKKRRASQEDEIEVLDELAKNSTKKPEKITVEVTEEVSVEEGNITSESTSSSQGDDSDIEMLDQSAVGPKEQVIQLGDEEEEDDEPQILEESVNTSGRSLRSGVRSHFSNDKCGTCRQRLSEVKTFSPGEGAGEEQVVADPRVNIILDTEEEDTGLALQYKLTDFTVYDGENHLVPIFAESLLSRYKKIYLAGRVLRLDQEEGEEGLEVVGLGPIVAWNNATGMEGGENNVIISSKVGEREVEYNLVRPSQVYLPMFETIFRMVSMANSIIVKLLDVQDHGGQLEYSEMLEFLDSLTAPQLLGKTLPKCDEEFLQLHSDFIVSQVRSWEGAGEEGEDWTISGMPCIKHISDMAGVERTVTGARKREGQPRITPQPETHVKAVTTPLVCQIFQSTFEKQMKEKQSKETGSKVCTCRACQRHNCGRCERCRSMVSFGGEQDDMSVTCIQRQCLKSMNVTLDGEEEDLEGVDWVNRVRWEGEGEKVNGGVRYQSCTLEVEGDEEVKLRPGMYLLVRPDREEDRSVAHFPCRLLLLEKRGGEELAHVQWLARGKDTVLGNTGDVRELFLTRDCEDVELSSLSRVLDLKNRPVRDIEAWKKAGGTEDAIDGKNVGGQDGWWRQVYQPEHGRFSYPEQEELKLGGSCYYCHKKEEQRELEQVAWAEDGSWVRMGGTSYTMGDFILLEDDTLRHRIPKKTPHDLGQEFHHAKKDPKLYPEAWRKPDMYKGDHHDTWEPFQVVRLEQARKKDGYVRVRKFYRPHDTHLTHEEARAEPYTSLFWSEEMARLYLPEVGERQGKPGMENIVGRAWVRPQAGGDQGHLMDWTEDGEDRFLCTRSYESATKTFTPLSSQLVDALEATLARRPAPQLASIKPLRGLDIFAGCGGLSKGLHHSGTVEPRWAVEFWGPSAQAYKKNNPKCEVINAECNMLLGKAMAGDFSTKMPRKGEVELMAGGPPCQGFSLLNNFKEGEYSKFKNSLISTYLSYCEFYRPRFFILENVRNLVAESGGMVLKLILASLVRMGYQVGFDVLQAGHFGVAQTRRRLIVMAAAPGEKLPLYPEPTHTFSGPHFQETDIDGRKFSTTCTRPGAPRRALTCWDAISDLPKIPSGHDKQTISYTSPPKSQLQRRFRVGVPDNKLEDHITKNLNALQQTRINLVPSEPGADWRDLPNKRVAMEDGRESRKLRYPYSKADGKRGVCNCATSTKRQLEPCDTDDKQSDNVIAWSLPHTADRHNNWTGVYGRVPWDGIFKTTITDPEPLGKQGQVLHPEQNRLLSVREFARSQGFDDDFMFAGPVRDKHREIGNAVPPPLGRALGLEIRKAVLGEKGGPATG